jgi:hypothetical protein
VVVAVVETFMTEVTGVAVVTATVDGFRLQVAGLVAPAGPATLQVRATFPVNPLEGVTAIDEVFPLMAPSETVRVPGLLLSAKELAGVTAALTVAVWVILPEVPVPTPVTTTV